MSVYYGGFWQRFVALAIDTVILYIFLIILFFVGDLIVPLRCGFTSLTDTPSTLMYTLFCPCYGMAIVLNACYFIYFHGTTGQTPGKKLLGLKVVCTDGKPLTYGVAFLRWVGYIISKLPFFLGFIWAGFDRRKQGWHDKIAGTCVIKTHRYQKIPDHMPSATRPEEEHSNLAIDEQNSSENSNGYSTLKEKGSDSEKT
ncbi:MAG TPA: RDD family protein [Syntrophales bacterium]|nr:RDD family protein [Syntrophales bacterium]